MYYQVRKESVLSGLRAVFADGKFLEVVSLSDPGV